MARYRKPIEIIECEKKSHRTKEEIEQRKEESLTVEPISEIIQPPEWMKDIKMREEFEYISKRLLDIGIFTDLDVDTLARYLVSKQNWIVAEKDVIEANKKNDRKEFQAAIKALNVITMECQKLAAALGLTIQSRCNLALPPKKEKEVNKFDEFLQ